MASDKSTCIICKGAEGNLKDFKANTWERVKDAAKRRALLQHDQFSSQSDEINGTENLDGRFYHSSCLSRFCAVKRKASSLHGSSEPSYKATRTSSSYPSSNTRGILKEECLFCGLKRKRKIRKTEPLSQCMTIDGSRTILLAARRKGDTRILALGEDLVAKEAKYHNSCRREYIRAVEPTDDQDTTIRKKHIEAFDILSQFINNEIIINQTPMLASDLFHLYKEQFLSLGGKREEIDKYAMQTLIKKIKEKFQDINVDKRANKSGNVMFPSSLSSAEAFSRLTGNSEKIEAIRCAAMVLRTEILGMPPTKTPSPTSLHTLKENAPAIPDLILFFFRTLVGGLQTGIGMGSGQEVVDRKAMALSSDAIFNCSRGNVKPWKHQTIGLGLGALTGSKNLVTIMNRLGHCIGYEEVKGLETEIAYTCSNCDRETPAGLHLLQDLGTGLAWDNFDVNTETLDGKDTLHATVGICYQNELPSEPIPEPSDSKSPGIISGRKRKSFRGEEKKIPPFYTSLRLAKFNLGPSTTTTSCTEIVEKEKAKIQQEKMDFIWLLQSSTKKIPLHTGFFSQCVTDSLPTTRIAYMDPISHPPTRNDVVQETMMRSIKVSQETSQEYTVVTYDLAVALKAYEIQNLQTPTFDKVIVMLGNFHLELAYFGALGTYLAESGIEYLLTEAGVLAEGSLNGFMKGKFYNRCTRLHQVLAAVMEQSLLTRFIETLEDPDRSLVNEVVSDSDCSIQHFQVLADRSEVNDLQAKYETFFEDAIAGKYGGTTAYWGIYIFFVNRVYRELQRAVRTNDVQRYIQILPNVINVFFALNRPNYARWGSLFLHKLQNMDPQARKVLEAGAMSIRRTKKSYSRCAVDLSLEQTINKDAASPLKGITTFTNSHNAFRRWAITLSQRSKALTELRELVALHQAEESINQLTKRRIERDNADKQALAHTMASTCNPFAKESPTELINISSGRTAKEVTSKFLLSTLERGEYLRLAFRDECAADASRFLKPVRKIKMLNFAAENAKRSKTAVRRVNAAEGARDVFGRMLAVAAESTDVLDLQHILSFPLTEVPLSLAHSDGTPLKTEKAALTRKLECKQETSVLASNLPVISASVIDGGIIIHETVLLHSKSTYGIMARDLLQRVCSSRGKEIHLVLDKYQSPSIKDPERSLRQSTSQSFIITGPDQAQRQSGIELLKSSSFKEEFAKFVMTEWRKPAYATIVGERTLYVSHGGSCIKLKSDGNNQLEIDQPGPFQCKHEEADTLIAFHAREISDGNILVRSSDTDVFIILLGLCGRSPRMNIIMDYGSGNNRRYIDVSHVAAIQESEQPGSTEALIGLHALTGCDFTSSFFRKGKTKPLQKMETSIDHIQALRTLTSDEVDVPAITSFVCSLYGCITTDINEARSKAFKRISSGGGKGPLAKLKKINCSSLPPCAKTLGNHIKRAHYVARMWKRADQTEPTNGAHPVDYGWKSTNNCFEPEWYPGTAVPESLRGPPTTHAEDDDSVRDEEVSDDDWSEESDDSDLGISDEEDV